MILLDENIPKDQRELLLRGGFKFRYIPKDFGQQGMDDEDIIPLLLRLKRPSFVTRDEDFWDRRLVHPRYALVWFDVEVEETAFFVRRFFAQPFFRNASQRLGKVLRVHASGIECWSRPTDGRIHFDWP